jgi:L-threonine kinase
MLSEIEPNDGLHYPGTVAYKHTRGELIESVPYIPAFDILGIDLGGQIDTVSFNQQPLTLWNESQMQEYSELLDDALVALKMGDDLSLAHIATKSTHLWQRILPKPQLGQILKLAEKTGAMGVVNTHSGTYLGLLYERHEKDRDAIENYVHSHINAKLTWYATLDASEEKTIIY